MIVFLIIYILILFNNYLVKSDIIQYIQWDNITQGDIHLDFIKGSTVLFSVTNNTGDHNIVIKESFQKSDVIKSPILNFNNNQIYFIYTFTKTGNYTITDDFSNKTMGFSISSSLQPLIQSQSSSSSNDSILNNSSSNNTLSSEISTDSYESLQQNDDDDFNFNNFLKIQNRFPKN